MSHFSVAVFTKYNGDTVDELLAPYDENIVVVPYIKYTKEELIQIGRKEILDYKNTTYAKYLSDPKAYEASVANNSHMEYIKNIFPKKLGLSDEEIYQSQIQLYDEGKIDKNGNIYSTRNPSSKWDWYVVGGRFSGHLKLKGGAEGQMGERSWTNEDKEILKNRADIARVGNIDFSPYQEYYDIAILEWELVVDKRLPKSEREIDFVSKSFFYKPQYYIDKYKNKEQFAEISSFFTTHAVITPEGNWHETGEMGMWGTSSATNEEELEWALNYKKQFIDTADKDWTLTIVDCHI